MADVVSVAHKVGKCFGQDSGFDRLDDMLLETWLDCDEPMGRHLHRHQERPPVERSRCG